MLIRGLGKSIPQGWLRGCATVAKSSSSPAPPLDNVAKFRDFRASLPNDIAKPVSLSTASQQEITKYKVQQAIVNIQKHGGDTGSAPVQIAVMTEKIVNLARHFTVHKKDKHSQRGFQMLLAQRRKMMKYLKNYDFEGYRHTVKTLGLEKEASHI
jgi:small subunit ribosomal protein S15